MALTSPAMAVRENFIVVEDSEVRRLEDMILGFCNGLPRVLYSRFQGSHEPTSQAKTCLSLVEVIKSGI